MPASDEVLVRVLAVSVNHVDALVRSGRVDVGAPFPFIIGRDMVGIVEAIGASVATYAPGARVWSNCLGIDGRQGPSAEYVCVPEHLLFSQPEGVDPLTIVAVAHSALTALAGLNELTKLRSGETVFISGGSGNVGLCVIELARKAGARIISTAGNSEKAEICRQAGAHHVVLYKEVDVADAVHALAPGGVDVWWESSPVPDLEVAVDAMATGGRMIITTGFNQRASFTLGTFYTRLLTARGLAVTYLPYPELRRAALATNEALSQGVLKPRIAEVMHLSRARDAHRLLESGAVEGKLLLVTGEVSSASYSK